MNFKETELINIPPFQPFLQPNNQKFPIPYTIISIIPYTNKTNIKLKKEKFRDQRRDAWKN